MTTGCVGGHLKDTKGTGVLVAIHQDGSDFELVSLVSIVTIVVANPHHKKIRECGVILCLTF